MFSHLTAMLYLHTAFVVRFTSFSLCLQMYTKIIILKGLYCFEKTGHQTDPGSQTLPDFSLLP